MKVDSLNLVSLNPRVSNFGPGDTVKVSFRVREGERERAQVFQGVVIRRKGGGVGATFTVRRVAHSIGVERVFPLHSPLLESVEVVRYGLVRRARLYYLRNLRGKAARIKERRRPRGSLISERNKDVSTGESTATKDVTDLIGEGLSGGVSATEGTHDPEAAKLVGDDGSEPSDVMFAQETQEVEIGEKETEEITSEVPSVDVLIGETQGPGSVDPAAAEEEVDEISGEDESQSRRDKA